MANEKNATEDDSQVALDTNIGVNNIMSYAAIKELIVYAGNNEIITPLAAEWLIKHSFLRGE